MDHQSRAQSPVRRHPLKTPLGCFAAAFVIFAAVMCGGLLYLSATLTPGQVERPPLVEPELVARVSAEQAVRATMNDPGSYSYVSHMVTRVQVAEGLKGFEVRLVFRGRNALGGMIVNAAIVTTDDTGLNVLSIQ